MKATRKELLLLLIGLDRSLAEIRHALSDFPWDSETPLVVLDRKTAVAVLRRFLIGKLSASDLEDWANALEGREDIALEAGSEELMKALIFELANPLLVAAIDRPGVAHWVAELEAGAKAPTGHD